MHLILDKVWCIDSSTKWKVQSQNKYCAIYSFEVRTSLFWLNWTCGNSVGCTKIGQYEINWKKQKLHYKLLNL